MALVLPSWYRCPPRSPSLQCAVMDYSARNQYLNDFSNPAKQYIENLIDTVSGSLHFLFTSMQQLQYVEDAVISGERISRRCMSTDQNAELDNLATKVREIIYKMHEDMPALKELLSYDGAEPWMMSLRNDMQLLLNSLSPAGRVTVIGDREIDNAAAIVSHANHHPNELMLSGVFTPFHEIDEKVQDILGRVNDVRTMGYGFPTSDNGAMEAYGPCSGSIPFQHVPYGKEILADEKKRYEYCCMLLEQILATNPDIVFLSNFKVVLDKIVPRELEWRGILLINGHPSVLPLNRGYRTEKMAMDGINPQANGYTIHIATEELDRGPTLFQQHVPVHLYQDDSLSEKRLPIIQEEAQRRAIIEQQARYVPRILAIMKSNLMRRIVRGGEAFAVEDREPVGDKPDDYGRMIFMHEGGWKTIEQMIGAPGTIEVPSRGSRFQYQFSLRTSEPGYYTDAIVDFYGVCIKAGIHFASSKSSSKNQGACWMTVEIIGPNHADTFRKLGVQDLEVTEMPVRARAPRRIRR